jgi:PKD repeat protein
MFVDSPNHESFFRYFTGETFPLIDTINFTSSAGTYNIDGIFTNGGDTYIVKTSFEVTNSFNVDIDANKTTGEPDETFEFEATSSGGIGNVSYEWDFGDDTTTTGQEVEHKYSSVGEYEVELTATDNKGNKVTDTQRINVFNKHHLQIIVKELQTQHVMGDVPVEVDDERKHTDSKGRVNFTVYEGKRRIYVAYDGYEWVKQVRNITGDLTITIELNNTDSNYTYSVEDEVDIDAAAEAGSAKEEAEALLAQVSAAMESLNSGDQATKAVMASLGVEAGLQEARKQLRQVIRDLGNAESSTDLETDERDVKIEASKKMIDDLKSTITSIEVQDTTEFVDYPRASDIAMVSEEYLRYKKLEYTKRKKQNYVEQNTELQSEVTITTRLSIVDIELLSGDKKTVSVVINKLTKMPVDTEGKLIIEYLPKDVAKSASEIVEVTEFDVIKSDPILKFSPDVESYAYYVNSAVDIEKLKKTKHVMLMEPESQDEEGLVGVTGFSILSGIKIDNPKLAIEIALIIILLLAYVVYHFELVDRFKEWRKGKQTVYETDMAYQPESWLESTFNKVKAFVKKEDELLVREVAHIKSLIVSAHRHAADKDHGKASGTYGKIMESYKDLSREAKAHVHPETKHVFNKILLSKISHLLDDAHIHLQNRDHSKAQSHYSEIKSLYTKLEKEHRAAVSERCMRLHEKLFETSLT